VRGGQTCGRIRVGSSGRADSFQAGHASSILVTRSMAKALVGGSLSTLISTSALLRTSGDLRATARWFRTHTRSDRACPTRGGRIESVPQVTKSFIVSVLSPGAPASPRQPWTPHRTDIPVAFSPPNLRMKQTGRRLREQITIAASQSACILLPNRVPERRLGTRQYRHFNQLSPNSSYQDKVRSKNAYIEEVTPAAGRPSTASLQRSCCQGPRCLRVVAWLKVPRGPRRPRLLPFGTCDAPHIKKSGYSVELTPYCC
jgi:hypothetical protein